MITSIELASIVYKAVSATQIKTIIDGDVYLGVRPTNSAKTDVVIATLSVPDIELQNSTALIQIYAKDIFDGKTYTPNLKKLNDATTLLAPLFRKRYIEEKKTYLDVEWIRDYQVQGVQEWVSVIRLKTRTVNN